MSISSGDTAWILVSSALVMLMTPGVALFYGGMVRRKNVLSTLMMSFAALGLVGLLWILYGYSLSFGPDKAGIIGGLDWIGLSQVGQEPSAVYATTVPHLAFMIFQAMFAIITVALITGAVVERIKFSALLVFSALWLTFVYSPVAHWVWGDGGWLANLGALDFAGGTVVHISAGVSALALAVLLGPRKGFRTGEPMEPHNIPMVMIGAGLLWFGWFGFNAGSALTSGGLAASAFVATNTAAAAAAFTWMILSWIYRRPTALGTATGAVAGLVAITPAAGFVSPIMGVPIGIGAAVICYYCILFRMSRRIDESLDVWAVHGMGGTWGALATGIFANAAVNSAGADGLLLGNVLQLSKQFIGVAAVWVFAFVATLVLGKLIDITIGLRVGGMEETVGLDISQHGERAYGGVLR
ncbi:MAG: ammonium transporter [Dehalococcoidales bacterium]|jgi:Amt family ammonium transporter|nr:ammonium transporter [Dehalococcoidales bacterium]